MTRITAYVVGILLSIFFLVNTSSYNNIANAASVKGIKTVKKAKSRRFRLAGCHNLSTSRLNAKASRFHRSIVRAARKYNVSSNLIKAVITTESCFKPRARGTSGEKGLMQLMYATGKRFNVKNRYSPQQNINGGAKYLSFLLRRYSGSKRHAVAAYNTGEGRIRLNGYIPNKAYVYKVMSAYHKFNRSRFNSRGLRNKTYRGKRLRIKNRRYIYRVKRGDTISKIAKRHRISTRKLIKSNRLKRPYRLKVGSKIYLNKRTNRRTVKYKKSRNKYYRVRRNDNLRKISRRTGISIRKIKRLNRLRKGQKLVTGKRLNLKRRVKIKSKKRFYVVRPGNTIYSVMRKTGVSMKRIIRKNNLKKPYRLRINQRLRIK